MTPATLSLMLSADSSNAIDQSELDRLTRALADALDAPELTESVSLAEDNHVRSGAKGFAADLGKLVLEVAPKALPALLDFLKGWLTRNRRVKLKVAVGDSVIEADFDPDSMDEDRLAALTERLRKQLTDA